MRSLVVLTSVLSALVLSRAHAQPSAASDPAEAPSGPRSEPATGAGSTGPDLAPAPAPAAATATPPAPPEAVAPAPATPVPPATPATPAARQAAALESQLAEPRAVELPSLSHGADDRAASAERTKLADDWIAFEAERDVRTRKAERVFYPLTLGVEAALGIAYAVLLKDEVTTTSRVLAGASAGLALGAMVPTLLSRSRGGQRAWFTLGAAAFAVGAGATIALAADNDTRDRSARWVGASVALQGLALLPIALIPGFPEESEYEAYRRLPESERPAAAARILTRIDRFEQRATAIALVGALSAAIVMSAGAMVSDNHDQARRLGGLSLVPLTTVLVGLAPRLFVRNRTDRYAVGEQPTKLPFNSW